MNIADLETVVKLGKKYEQLERWRSKLNSLLNAEDAEVDFNFSGDYDVNVRNGTRTPRLNISKYHLEQCELPPELMKKALIATLLEMIETKKQEFADQLKSYGVEP